ncbi:hypothetical protein ASPCADRAFT_394095 [Aspergillus carbonarius ITEM 5010]|uniref:C6 and C2H2 transcription factor n=1 Tax=Aspergillus carbonarius (strain ITEM 5010) TaxID=602072 RepID=A0A1R3RW44_ASPC5|nr:hypothetical protein ASPCADRAFT_394095 [Aspergillus carbonarius ITEM 5010]
MPPRSEAESSRASFRCSYPGCRATYQRKEHLTRHRARHDDQGKRFSCPHCDSFLRALTISSDLLRRHVQNYHPSQEPPASRAQKACRACHIRKERCDGGSPCDRCQRRSIVCSRTGQATVREEDNPPDTHELFDIVPRWFAQDFIDTYFDEFHPAWPFLHRRTFNVSKEPCILLQSMVMMGLWIKGDRDTAMTFHRKLLSAVQEQKVHHNDNDNHTPWPIATYQGILLQLIFAALVAKQESTLDLNLRCQLPGPQYELLISLVATCRRRGIFSYPNMLMQYDATAPIALIWVGVEEIKRFGLALYKLCRLCGRSDLPPDRHENDRSELLTLADLDFCLPDSDAMWEGAPATMEEARSLAVGQTCRDNRNPDGWISQSSGKLYDAGVRFDWI